MQIWGKQKYNLFLHICMIFIIKKIPIINIIVDLEKDEYYGIYNIKESINTLNLPVCGSVLNDKHFDSNVCKFESHAKLLDNFV